MLAVYYKVYREAMKQKKSMQMTIRTIPVDRNLAKNSFEMDKTTTELLEQEPHKANTISPAELDTNGTMEPRPGPGKRISLETAMMDARMKARNSIFVTSGTNILEGDETIIF